MKRLITLILSVMAIQASFAATVKVHIDDLYYNLDTSAKTAEVTYDTSSEPYSSNPAYTNFSDKNLIIPSTVEYSEEQYVVTTIGNSAFYGCSGLTSITLPKNLTSIDAWAFGNCSGLKEVNIKSLEAWLNIRFSNYKGNPNYYAQNLLIDGIELSGTVNLPADWIDVPTAQFAGCKAVTEFIFPENLTSIGEYAFNDCSGLTSVNLPENLTSIGTYAFEYCTGLKEVNIKSLEAWLKLRFPDNSSNPNYYAKNLLIDGVELSGTVNLPADWTEVPDVQFAGCKAVNEFIFPENLTSIGNYAFYGCSGLTSVSLPENLTTIGSMAFMNCSGLTSVTLPENLTSIGNSAFWGCSSLKEVNIKSFEAWLKLRFPGYSSNPNYYAKNLLIDGKELSGVITLPSDWIEVPEYQFAGCKAVTEFIFPKMLTTIGSYAFQNCSGLTSVTLPESLTAIGASTFGFCSGLTSITLPENLTSIGINAFNNCSKLLKIVSLNPITPTNNSNSFGDPAESTGVLYVPEEAVQAYQSTNCWNEFQNIKPIVLATGLELSAEKDPLTIGHTQKITATLTPEDATVDHFKWSSSDESVATVDGFGKVTALKAGTTTITAKTIDGSDIEGTLELKVTDSNGSFEIEDFEMLLEEDLSVPVNLDLNFSDYRYSALQFDLSLPEEIELKSVVLGDQLLEAAMDLTYKVQDNGDVRIIVIPTENLDGVNCTDDILFLNLTASENATPATSSILISNASLSTVNGADIFLEDSSCEVTLRKLLLGDANDNGSVTVADVVTIANFIAKKEVVGWCFVNADVVKDNEINVRDITGTVNIISNETLAPAAISRRVGSMSEEDRLVIDDFKPVPGESFRIGVRLNNTRQYSALQSSIVIPEGMTVEGISKGTQASSHSLVHNITDEGRVEVVVFSTSNKPFSATEGSLFDLQVRATADCGDINMENILASDATTTDYELMYEGGHNTGIVTGIDDIDGDLKVFADPQGITVYNAEGLKINIYFVTGELVASCKGATSPERFNLGKGIYVVTVDGKTFKIKI